MTGLSPTYVGSANASQNSLVYPTLLSGSGTAATYGKVQSPEQSDALNQSSSSLFVAAFTVTTPTQLSLTGTLASEYVYIEGNLPAPSTTFSLTSSTTGSLYSASAIPQPEIGGTITTSTPLSFQTILKPGETYTLTVDSIAAATWNTSDPGAASQDSASFNFTATVPEPTTAILLPTAGAFLRRRRR